MIKRKLVDAYSQSADSKMAAPPPPMPADSTPEPPPRQRHLPRRRRRTHTTHFCLADLQCGCVRRSTGCIGRVVHECIGCAVHCPRLPGTADFCTEHYDFPWRCTETSLWCLNIYPPDGSCRERKCGDHCLTSACGRHFGPNKPVGPKSTNKKRGERTNRPQRRPCGTR